MRDTLREGGITSPGRLALYIGGTAVSAAVGSAVLNLVHRTPWWLLVVFFLGLMVMAWGGIVIKTEKRLHDATRANELQGGAETQGIDKRIALNKYRSRGAELAAGPPNEALAQEWSDEVGTFLTEEGWLWPDVERFQNAGTGTAANRLRPRADALGPLIARLGSSAIADESGIESAE